LFEIFPFALQNWNCVIKYRQHQNNKSELHSFGAYQEKRRQAVKDIWISYSMKGYL